MKYSQEANNSSASQEIPVLWKPKNYISVFTTAHHWSSSWSNKFSSHLPNPFL